MQARQRREHLRRHEHDGPDYIGKHPGTAFLEVQFYPPGWAPWPPGVSCDASKWCAAMAIFSLTQDQNTGVLNNDDCLGHAPGSSRRTSRSSRRRQPARAAEPARRDVATFTPNAATDLFMGSGDKLTVDIHDGRTG